MDSDKISKREQRDPTRTTKVTVRFLNKGWQDKLWRAMRLTEQGGIRESIAKAFLVLIPHHENLTHGQLANILELIADGRYTLDDALRARNSLEERATPATKEQAALKIRALRNQLTTG